LKGVTTIVIAVLLVCTITYVIIVAPWGSRKQESQIEVLTLLYARLAELSGVDKSNVVMYANLNEAIIDKADGKAIINALRRQGWKAEPLWFRYEEQHEQNREPAKKPKGALSVGAFVDDISSSSCIAFGHWYLSPTGSEHYRFTLSRISGKWQILREEVDGTARIMNNRAAVALSGRFGSKAP
jgi:hypothetical protein